MRSLPTCRLVSATSSNKLYENQNTQVMKEIDLKGLKAEYLKCFPDDLTQVEKWDKVYKDSGLKAALQKLVKKAKKGAPKVKVNLKGGGAADGK